MSLEELKVLLDGEPLPVKLINTGDQFELRIITHDPDRIIWLYLGETPGFSVIDIEKSEREYP